MKTLRALTIGILLALSTPAAANWGTSTAQPVNPSNACLYPSDFDADCRGLDYICTWSPDAGETGWDDTAGRRGDRCIGNPATGDVDVTSNGGTYCTRIHGITSTDAAPMGFYLGWQYMRWMGLYGVDMNNWWADLQIVSYHSGPNTHVLFCNGDLTGTPGDPCRGTASTYDPGNAGGSGQRLSFTPHSFTVGTNAPQPAACPATVVQQRTLCAGHDKSGLQTMLAGDGFPRAGGYAVLGNPITGPGGVPCLGHDAVGTAIVFVYPLQGAPTTNPDGTAAFVAVCP